MELLKLRQKPCHECIGDKHMAKQATLWKDTPPEGTHLNIGNINTSRIQRNLKCV